MMQYGARRKMYGGLFGWGPSTHNDYARGNRGRNRQDNGGRYPLPRKCAKWQRLPQGQKIVDRSTRKRTRRQGKEEICNELGLWQLERDFEGALRRPRFTFQKTRRGASYCADKWWSEALERIYAPVMGAREIDRKLEDLKYERDYYEDMLMMDLIDSERDVDDYEDSIYNDSDWEYDDSSDWGDYWDDMIDPEPSSPEWRDLWVAAQVSDPEGRDGSQIEYGEIHDFCYSCKELVEHCECDVFITMREVKLPEDPRIHSDDDRNNERLRAGERYYRQHKRTVQKEGV